MSKRDARKEAMKSAAIMLHETAKSTYIFAERGYSAEDEQKLYAALKDIAAELYAKSERLK